MLNEIASVIGKSMNWIILALCIITLIGFYNVWKRNAELNKKIEDDARRKRGRVEPTAGGFTRNAETNRYEDTLEYFRAFNEIEVKYSVTTQLIPVFPLLGILGTVSGLIMELDNLAEMRAAMGVSMSTTFYGLLAAIVLRLIDAFFISKALLKTQQKFDTFEQDYQIAKDKLMQDADK